MHFLFSAMVLTITLSNATARLDSLPTPEITPISCPETLKPLSVNRGRINVPLDYARPQGEQLSLWFALSQGNLLEPKSEAFTFVFGGPGESSSESLPGFPRVRSMDATRIRRRKRCRKVAIAAVPITADAYNGTGFDRLALKLNTQYRTVSSELQSRNLLVL